MRQPQEVPDRTSQMLEGLKAMGIPVLQPADQGAGPISKVHDLGYLRFLESAHRRWMEMEDWGGDEVMSNIFVRSPPNAMRGGILQKPPVTWQTAAAPPLARIPGKRPTGRLRPLWVPPTR